VLIEFQIPQGERAIVEGWKVVQVTVMLYAAKKSVTASWHHCCSGLQCCRLIGVTSCCLPYEKSTPCNAAVCQICWPHFVVVILDLAEVHHVLVNRRCVVRSMTLMRVWRTCRHQRSKQYISQTAWNYSRPWNDLVNMIHGTWLDCQYRVLIHQTKM